MTTAKSRQSAPRDAVAAAWERRLRAAWIDYLRIVQDELGERMGQDIFMYSITLQPHFDRPHILKDYAELWEVKPGNTSFHFILRKKKNASRANDAPFYQKMGARKVSVLVDICGTCRRDVQVHKVQNPLSGFWNAK